MREHARVSCSSPLRTVGRSFVSIELDTLPPRGCATIRELFIPQPKDQAVVNHAHSPINCDLCFTESEPLILVRLSDSLFRVVAVRWKVGNVVLLAEAKGCVFYLQVRCAAVFALGTFVGNTAERTDHSTTIDHNVAMMLAQLINDGSPVVRKVGKSPAVCQQKRPTGLVVPFQGGLLWPRFLNVTFGSP